MIYNQLLLSLKLDNLSVNLLSFYYKRSNLSLCNFMLRRMKVIQNNKSFVKEYSEYRNKYLAKKLWFLLCFSTINTVYSAFHLLALFSFAQTTFSAWSSVIKLQYLDIELKYKDVYCISRIDVRKKLSSQNSFSIKNLENLNKHILKRLFKLQIH